MSYSLVLVRVPPGSTEEEVEQAVHAANEAESVRPPKARNDDTETIRKWGHANGLI